MALDAVTIIHFITIAATTACSTIGVSIGQGLATKASFDAANRQPAAQEDIMRSLILALAVIETGAIFGLVIPLLLFFNPPSTLYKAIAEIGMGISISLPALGIGYASSLPAKATFHAISRQPFHAKKIRNLLLFVQSFMQTPLIFGFITALLIWRNANAVSTAFN